MRISRISKWYALALIMLVATSASAFATSQATASFFVDGVDIELKAESSGKNRDKTRDDSNGRKKGKEIKPDSNRPGKPATPKPKGYGKREEPNKPDSRDGGSRTTVVINTINTALSQPYTRTSVAINAGGASSSWNPLTGFSNSAYDSAYGSAYNRAYADAYGSAYNSAYADAYGSAYNRSSSPAYWQGYADGVASVPVPNLKEIRLGSSLISRIERDINSYLLYKNRIYGLKAYEVSPYSYIRIGEPVYVPLNSAREAIFLYNASTGRVESLAPRVIVGGTAEIVIGGPVVNDNSCMVVVASLR